MSRDWTTPTTASTDPSATGPAVSAAGDAIEGLYSLDGEHYIAADERPGHAHTLHYDNSEHPTWQDLLAGMEPSWIHVKLPKGGGVKLFLENAAAVGLYYEKWKSLSVLTRPPCLIHEKVLGQLGAVAKAAEQAAREPGKIKWPEHREFFAGLREKLSGHLTYAAAKSLLCMAADNARSVDERCMEPVLVAFGCERDGTLEDLLQAIEDFPQGERLMRCTAAVLLLVVAMDVELYGKGELTERAKGM